MKQNDYFKFHEDLCNEARALSQKKNNDYADPDNREGDPFAIFANFMQCEHLGICEVEQGFLVRLSDKFSRLCNILKPGHKQGVMDESIRDTALDIINYVALLLGYLETKRLQGPHWADGFPEPPVETDEEKKAEAKRRALGNELVVRLKHVSPDLQREWGWFRSRLYWNGVADVVYVWGRFQAWRRRKAERGPFACPLCFSIYWGTVGDPSEPGCKGHCNGTSHGHLLPDGSRCNFEWDRNTEDKFVGLGKKP